MNEKTDNELINEILAKAKDKGITFNLNVDILISEMTMLLQKERALLLLSQSKMSKLEKVREAAYWIDKETHIDKCKQTGNYEVIVDMDQNRMGDMFSELRQALKELEE